MIEILPSDGIAFLRSRGGIAGIDRRAFVTGDGNVVLWSERQPEQQTRSLAGDVFADLLTNLEALPYSIPPAKTEGGADLMEYELAWVVRGAIRTTNLDDGTLDDATPNGSARAVIRALQSVW